MSDQATSDEQLARCRRMLISVTDRQFRERIEEYARELEAHINTNAPRGAAKQAAPGAVSV